MVNEIRTSNPHGLNKGCGLKFHVGSHVSQTPEEGWRTYWPKYYEYNNRDEDNSPKNLNAKKSSSFISHIQTIDIFITIIVKLATIVKGNLKAPFFDSYYNEVYERVLLLSLDCSTLPLIHSL